MYSLYLLFRSSVNLIPKCRIVSTVALLKFKQRNTNFCAQIDNSDIRFACRFLLVPLSQFGTSDDVGICTAEASSTSPDFSMRTTTLPDALLSSRILLLSSSFSAELSPSVSSISLNCLHSSRQPRSETTRPPLLEQRVLGWCRSHKGASVAEKREAAKLIMEGFMQAYDDKAAEFTPQWYNHRAQPRSARLK